MAIRGRISKEPLTPEMKPVDSTALRAVGHSRDRLDVEFTSGAKYRYFGVSKATATKLRRASSKGRHFVKNVRNNYQYSKLRNPTKATRKKKRR